MKKTLLQLTQEILGSIDGDEVNSFADTTESLQVSAILENTYWDIVSTKTFPAMKTAYSLNGSNDSSKPTLMTLPNTFLTLEWLMYDQTNDVTHPQNFQELKYLRLEDFLQGIYSYDQSDVNVITYYITLTNGNTLRVLGRKDGAPKYYTTVDDFNILFESYDSNVDTSLQTTKSLAYGERSPIWTMVDTFIPDLPDKQFTILRNQAKATASAELRQTTNTEAAKRARKGWIVSQRDGGKVPSPRDNRIDQPNYSK